MPGCAAVNCSNSAKKGFSMKRFPTDPKRRKEWLIKMRRDKWTPTDCSRLCEAHFASEMWEKSREDGKGKLRMDAVPTLFSFTHVKEKRKPPSQRIQVAEQPPCSSRAVEIFSSSCEVPAKKLLCQVDASVGSITTSSLSEMEISSEIATVASTSQASTSEGVSNISSGMEVSGMSSDETFGAEDTSAIFQKLSRKEKLAKYENIYRRKVSSLRSYKKELRNYKLKYDRLSTQT